MANKNEFLPFANNSTSNVIEQSSYDTLDARKTGFASGVAKSAQLNKVWRQSSVVAAAIGQFIADTNKIDVLDDGDVPKLAIELGKAISSGASGVKSFNGVVGAVTISEGNNVTIVKNGNDFKINAAGGTGGVTSVNGKTGAVTLTYSDVNAAPLASPSFTGAPKAPTPTKGDNSTNIATTAFVMQNQSTGAVTSVNGKTGAVTLTYSDVSAAPLASPAFTGTPTAPTATKGDATTKLATTAFVENAISGISAGVVSLNGISGAVNLVAGSNVTITPSGKNLTISASGGGTSGVTSVNGKTGVVNLTAADVGATTQAWVTQQGYATQTWVGQQGFVKANVANSWTALQTANVNNFDTPAWNVAGGGKQGFLTPTTVQIRESGVGIQGWIAGYIGCVPVSGGAGSGSWQASGLHQNVNAYKPGGGAWADASDIRTKQNVSPILDSLSIIKGLRPVQFSRTWSPNKTEVGFIADEVEKILPTAVSEISCIKYVNENGERLPQPFDEVIDELGENVPFKVLGFKNDIFAYLVGGIKELAEIAAKQQIEIEELKAKIK